MYQPTVKFSTGVFLVALLAVLTAGAARVPAQATQGEWRELAQRLFEVDAIPELTRQGRITVSGVARLAGSLVRIDGGVSRVETTAGPGRRFSARVKLHRNHVNHLVFTEIGQDGTVYSPVARSVTHDRQPPTVAIEFPLDKMEIANSTVNVVGRVGDVLSGFLGLSVTVNGQQAEVNEGVGTNGSFLAAGVPLDPPGQPTVLQAVATDALGNVSSHTISVTRIDVQGPHMAVTSGDGQSAAVYDLLPQPLIVKVELEDGSPFAGKVVSFEVARNDGRLSPDGVAPGTRVLQVHTDASGQAAAFWRLGGTAGAGNQRVSVSSNGISGTVFFCASGNPGPATQINVSSGHSQRAEAGAAALQPLRVWVSDACNGVAGAQVDFEVVGGFGLVDGVQQVTVLTDAAGYAQVEYTLGRQKGDQRVQATLVGAVAEPAWFTLWAVERDPALATRFEGVVLDNSGRRIGGAECVLVVGVTRLTIASDVEGRFDFADTVESGPADLFVDGSVATTLDGGVIAPGSYPRLHYEHFLVPDAANRMTAPVLLPPLNPDNTRLYSSTTDTVLTVAGIAGFRMIVKAGSMFVDGAPAPDGTPMSLNAVHHDDIPMPIPDGAAPVFAWTVQPGGAVFDPPVEIRYPNFSALPAGAITSFLSFDHDTGRFEIIASGQVSDDGQTIVTDPGSGLSKAGWGCNCPPYSVVGRCRSCPMEIVGDTFMPINSQRLLQAFIGEDLPLDGTYKWTKLSGVANIIGPDDQEDLLIEASGVADSNIEDSQFKVRYTYSDGDRNCSVNHELTVARVEFKEGFLVANYGYDKNPDPNDLSTDFVSLDRSHETEVVVTVQPYAPDTYVLSSRDTAVFTVDKDDEVISDPTDNLVLLSGSNSPATSTQAMLDLRPKNGTAAVPLNSLSVRTYKKRLFDQLGYFRIKDSSSPIDTDPPAGPTLEELKGGLNEIFVQAVIEIALVDGDLNSDLAYDLNKNGNVDYYVSGDNLELKVLEDGVGTEGEFRVAFVKALRRNWRLAEGAKKGDTVLKLDSSSTVPLNDDLVIGPALGGPSEPIKVIRLGPGADEVTLESALLADHPVAHTMYGSLCGISTDPLIVTQCNGGGEFLETIAHEMLHRVELAGLSHVGSDDNVMYVTSGVTDHKLRFRALDLVDSEGKPTGKSEQQWESIIRN